MKRIEIMTTITPAPIAATVTPASTGLDLVAYFVLEGAAQGARVAQARIVCTALDGGRELETIKRAIEVYAVANDLPLNRSFRTAVDHAQSANRFMSACGLSELPAPSNGRDYLATSLQLVAGSNVKAPARKALAAAVLATPASRRSVKFFKLADSLKAAAAADARAAKAGKTDIPTVSPDSPPIESEGRSKSAPVASVMDDARAALKQLASCYAIAGSDVQAEIAAMITNTFGELFIMDGDID
jgi:hypothetical protein